MYLPPKASRIRQKEAQNARNNRAEIVKALSQGEITKRDLIKWGIFTAGGALVVKNGLSPFARSAFGAGKTGVPRSPLFGAKPFTQPFNRVRHVPPTPIKRERLKDAAGNILSQDPNDDVAVFLDKDGNPLQQPAAKRLSYHTDYNARQKALGLGLDPSKLDPAHPNNEFRNKLTNRGPMEGRPYGEAFSHQRWDEFFPKVGYILSWGQCEQPVNGIGGTRFHPSMAPQEPNAVWTYGFEPDERRLMPPCLIKLRYGEPALARVYNRLPVDPSQNGGFGRNQSQLHFHNMHNGAESDGAANVHHYPGTFYDYRWSTTLARRDKTNTTATDARASGPSDPLPGETKGGLVNVAGDWREIQGSMWAHDHRFFFTAENVYKGNLMMCNLYSGLDRGSETHIDNVNLRLPSGSLLDWGNTDFDVNLIVSDGGTDAHGQYFFDIFTTDGFVGDLPLVNFAYKPVMQVLPRKYRFRTINCSMSRFIKLAIADPKGNRLKLQFIANDGNLVVNPIDLLELDEQGTAERYDIVVDFSGFKTNDTLHLVNLLQQTGGNKPDGALTMANALAGKSPDPCVGAILQFKIVDRLESVDVPGVMLDARDPSVVSSILTEQIPIVSKPVRTRIVEFGRGNGDSRGANGQCTPDCSTEVTAIPWIIKVNGQAAHSMNANRISELIPKAGEIEHWTYINGGGGWDHPIHLHFEEGVTMNRGNDSIPPTEKLVRKDVWRLRPSGRVQFQVQFGEYGGSYVNHCHNTVHEDFALLMRIQLLADPTLSQVKDVLDPSKSVVRGVVTATPNPTPDGIIYTKPVILPEGDPANTKFFNQTSGGGSTGKTTTTTSTSGGGGTAKPSGKG
ncbi:MAG: multicopper oxidase domain-containing protein [Hyphomicrobium sp.]|jgi:FtsP/CotA-like multicopper oxidase with cupredoxin domain